MDVEFIKSIYNSYYSSVSEEISDRALNTVCWNSAFDSRPYTQNEMREWRDDTVAMIKESSPKKILEVACGTGMIMLSLIDDCTNYTGVDIAEEGIAYIESKLTDEEKKKSSLYVMEANDINLINDKDFDIAFINSATQYMGPEETFEKYIGLMIDHVKPNGRIFLGDIKSLTFRNIFYRCSENYENPESAEEKAVNKRRKFDFEFYMNGDYLQSFKNKFPRVKAVEIRAKRGKFPTEMNLFRFNAVLYLDSFQENETLTLNGYEKNFYEITEEVKNSGAECICIENLTNKLLYEEIMCKFSEQKNENNTVYISDICKALEKCGYSTYAMPMENELDLKFKVIAEKKGEENES